MTDAGGKPADVSLSRGSKMTIESNDDSAHRLTAVARVRASRWRWRAFTFVAVVIAILALAGRFGAQQGLSEGQIAKVEITGTIATDADRVALLKKLGDDPKAPRFIRTVRSAGYMLVDPNAPPA